MQASEPMETRLIKNEKLAIRIDDRTDGGKRGPTLNAMSTLTHRHVDPTLSSTSPPLWTPQMQYEMEYSRACGDWIWKMPKWKISANVSSQFELG